MPLLIFLLDIYLILKITQEISERSLSLFKKHGGESVKSAEEEESDEGSEDVDHPRGGFRHFLDTLHSHGLLVAIEGRVQKKIIKSLSSEQCAIILVPRNICLLLAWSSGLEMHFETTIKWWRLFPENTNGSNQRNFFLSSERLI